MSHSKTLKSPTLGEDCAEVTVDLIEKFNSLEAEVRNLKAENHKMSTKINQLEVSFPNQK